jgi:hypothetical protein
MGHVAYSESKDEGKHSMSRKRLAAEHMYAVVSQDPRTMVKAKLLKVQFPRV